MEERKLVEEALQKHHLFGTLTDGLKNKVLSSMRLVAFNAKEFIFRQGQSGYHVYVIVSGRTDIVVNNKQIKVAGVGEILGERALMGNIKRTASVFTTVAVKLWVLNGEDF